MSVSASPRAASAAHLLARKASPASPQIPMPTRRYHSKPSCWCPPFSRLFSPVTAAGKGFGSSDKKEKKDEPAAKARQALERATSSSPIDPEEASRGRIDVATVKSWSGLEDKRGGGGRDALGELELRSFTPGGDASSASASSASASSASPSPPLSPLGSQPLYEALARRLSVLQSSGALDEGEEGGGATDHTDDERKRRRNKGKLPRFEDWRWREERYVQFLADCLEVHSALEEAVGGALGAAEGAMADRRRREKEATSPPPSPSSPASASLAAYSALSYLGPGRGLSRAAEIAADLAAIFRTTTDEAFVQGGGADGDGDASGDDVGPVLPPPAARKEIVPSASATETARHLLDLGSRAAAEALEEIGIQRGREGASEDDDDVDERLGLLRRDGVKRRQKEAASQPPLRRGASASLRLLANCYALHVTHLTTGMRVGASASEALRLLERRAAGFYQTYDGTLSLAPRRPPLLSPSVPGSSSTEVDNKRVVDPLRAFRSAVDGAGRAMVTTTAETATEEGGSTTTATTTTLSPATSMLLLEEVEKELVPAVKRAAALFEPLASAE